MKLLDECPLCCVGRLRCSQTKRIAGSRKRYLVCDHCDHRGVEVVPLRRDIAAISEHVFCPHCGHTITPER